MFQNIILAQYGTFHDTPLQKDSYFLSPFKTQVWFEEEIAHQQFMSVYKLVLLTLGQTCTCREAKPQSFHIVTMRTDSGSLEFPKLYDIILTIF
jgi:hypothetical protein